MLKNPFPGMNPYLERHWGDVHSRLVLYASNQLNRQLPGSLRARVEERLVVENPDTEETRSIKPDVKVYDPLRGEGGGVAVLAPPVAVAEPDVIQLAEDEPATTTYLRIIDPATGGRLVTVVEVLSPSNKQPRKVKSADQYLAKRDELRMGGVSLVEVDLLRGGRGSSRSTRTGTASACPPRTPRASGEGGTRPSTRCTAFPCASGCRPSASRSAGRTPTCFWTSRPSSTRCTRTAGTTT